MGVVSEVRIIELTLCVLYGGESMTKGENEITIL